VPRDLRRHPRAIVAAVRGRLRAVFARDTIERELGEEMRFHLDMEIEKNLKAGMAPGDARRAALMSFGGVDRVAEAHRDARGMRVVEDVLADLRYAARALARTPGFVGVSVLTLAIAIAIGTALFTGANAFFYRPLPVPEGDRLVSVFTSDFDGRDRRGASSYADLVDFAREAEPIADLAGESRIMLGIGVNDDVTLVQGAIVSSRYFRVVRVTPAIGRFPSATAPQTPSIVLSHAFWRRAFGADTSVVGRQVRLNGQPFTVAAVAPPEFRGTSREIAVDFWIDGAFSPLVLLREDMLHRRGDRSFHIVGRLGEGRSIEALSARLSVVASRLFQAYPEAWRDTTAGGRAVTAMREQDAHLANVPRADRILVVGGVIAFGFGLLAIACANLASMQMARGAARRREIATRLALGAGRGRLIRQLLAECALVAVPGIVAGVVLALVVSAVVSHYRPIPVPSLDLALDWHALAFIAGALMLTLVVFGLVPALQTVRADVLTDLKGGDQPGARGLRIGGVRGGLIVAQVALSVVFTATAGLFAFALVRNANQGRDDARKVLVMRVNFLPAAGDADHVGALVEELLDAVRGIPGVETASAAAFIPVRGTRMPVEAEVRSDAGQVKRRVLDANFVRPGYFGVVGIPVMRGRDFEPRDLGGYRSAIVSKAMAGALWPGEDAIGKRMQIQGGQSVGQVAAEVIAVVADPAGHVPATDQSYPGLIYLPLRAQREAELILHFRAPTGQSAIATQVAQQLRRYNTRLVAPKVITLDEYIDRAVLPQRILARASGVVAVVQLVLAIAGLSGLVAYVTALRRREIGIRTALGASRGSVLALVMRQGIRLTAIGGTIGLGLSLIVARIVADSLPVTAPIVGGGLLLAAAIFGVVGTAAMLLPARRALDMAPAAALRVD
jgi:putative ABC transport system permease protein